MATSSVHFQSKRHDWETPDALFAKLNSFYNFDLDAAATTENARCANYFTPEQDGLMQSWAGRRVWVNPPYGRAIKDWVKKANHEAASAVFIVMLVPARTDTAWWHLATKHARPQFLRGRLTFKGAKASAPFPSALLYWNV